MQYYDHNERVRELRTYWDRRDVERDRQWNQVQWRIEQTRRKIDLDRLDAQLYFEAETTTSPPSYAPDEHLTLSEISESPRPGYTHPNLQRAIQDARSLMSAVAYGPHFNFLSAYEKQERIARLQICELKVGLALLRLDPPDDSTLMQINTLERQLGIAEEYLRNLTDPWHRLHHEWKSK